MTHPYGRTLRREAVGDVAAERHADERADVVPQDGVQRGCTLCDTERLRKMTGHPRLEANIDVDHHAESRCKQKRRGITDKDLERFLEGRFRVGVGVLSWRFELALERGIFLSRTLLSNYLFLPFSNSNFALQLPASQPQCQHDSPQDTDPSKHLEWHAPAFRTAFRKPS